MIIYLSYVDFRNPGVCINNGQNNLRRVYSKGLEKLFFKMLYTPTNVTSLSFLFVLSDVMASKTDL